MKKVVYSDLWLGKSGIDFVSETVFGTLIFVALVIVKYESKICCSDGVILMLACSRFP